jgi:hypothetical protein
MKPPVVVIERHCKTNQCWIAVRFKKIQSVAKISQSAAKSARMTPWQTSSTDGVAEKCFRHACARRSRKFSFSPSPSFFALATGESALTRAKKHRAEHRVPPTIERCLLPVTPDASGIRS